MLQRIATKQFSLHIGLVKRIIENVMGNFDAGHSTVQPYAACLYAAPRYQHNTPSSTTASIVR